MAPRPSRKRGPLVLSCRSSKRSEHRLIERRYGRTTAKWQREPVASGSPATEIKRRDGSDEECLQEEVGPNAARRWRMFEGIGDRRRRRTGWNRSRDRDCNRNGRKDRGGIFRSKKLGGQARDGRRLLTANGPPVRIGPAGVVACMIAGRKGRSAMCRRRTNVCRVAHGTTEDGDHGNESDHGTPIHGAPRNTHR